MNWLAIFNLLALFCISFAPARAEKKLHSKIKQASVFNGREVQTFDNGDVCLYEMTYMRDPDLKSYTVKDGSGRISRDFPIDEYNTAVTEDMISIKYLNRRAKLIVDGDTFAFYQKFFTLGDFRHQFPVSRVFQGSKICDGVSVIKAKKLEDWGAWLFAALDVDGGTATPRLIFPHKSLQLKATSHFDKEVTLVLDSLVELVIGIDFNNATEARKFCDFVKAPDEYLLNNQPTR